MHKIQFIGEERKETGKGAARKARRNDRIPGILYGPKAKPLPIQLDKKSAERIIRHLESHNVMGDLVLKQTGKDAKDKRIKTMLKDIQFNPVTGTIAHLDFYRIRMDRPVTFETPLNLVGESPGVEQGGILEQELRELQIEVLPKDIPERIDVDISSLGIGDALTVKDLVIPGENIRVLEDEERVVVAILAPREEEEEEVAPEEEEGAEPEVLSEEKAQERKREGEEQGSVEEEKPQE